MNRASGTKISLGPGRVSAIGDGGAIDAKSRIPRLSANHANRARSSSTERGRATAFISRKRSSSFGSVGNPILAILKTNAQRAPDFRKDKEENIKIVMNFLKETDYSGPYSHKILLSPSSKEYLSIFQFVYKPVDQQYCISTRPEDDIPLLYKNLGYPYTISRSSLITVATPHTWPLLLHALCWLIAFAEQMQLVSLAADSVLFYKDEGLENDDAAHGTTAVDTALMAMYAEEAYNEYMSGNDCLDDLNDKFSRNYLGPREELDDAERTNERLLKEMAVLVQTKDRTYELEVMLTQLDTSKAEILAYETKMRDHLQGLQDADGLLAEQVKTAIRELEEEEGQCRRLQHEFDSQELSPEDVVQMRLQRSTLIQEAETVRQDILDLNQTQWEKQMAITSHPVGKQCSKFNNALSQFVPQEMAARLGDLELRTSFVQGSEDKYNKVVKPLLQELMSLSMQRMDTHAKRTASAAEELAKFQGMMSCKEGDVQLLQQSLQKQESDYEYRKQKCQHTIDSLKHQLFILQQDLIELNKHKANAMRSNEQLKRQAYESRLRMAAERKEQEAGEVEMSSMLLAAKDMVLAHKGHIEESVMHFASRCVQTIDTIQRDCRVAIAEFHGVAKVHREWTGAEAFGEHMDSV